MLPQGYAQAGPAGTAPGPAAGSMQATPDPATMLQQVQQAQMRAVQQSMPQGYSGYGYGGYSGYQPPYAGSPQAAGGVPGGGAADGGWSAHYNSWVQQQGGGYGAQAQFQGAAAQFPSGGKPSKGFSKGKGNFKGKGKGSSKGIFGKDNDRDREPWNLGDSNLDPKKQIELAQRRAKQRDRGTIMQAQRSAMQRFEKEYLDRLQGQWYEESDGNISYVVDGGLCSVSGGSNARVFRNRITIYNGGLVLDAKRYWHKLDIDALPPVGEDVERCDWTPGEGSPPTKPMVWVRTQPPPKEGSTEPNAESTEAAEKETSAEAPTAEPLAESTPAEEATAP